MYTIKLSGQNIFTMRNWFPDLLLCTIPRGLVSCFVRKLALVSKYCF